MDRVQDGSVCLGCSDLADVFTGREGQPWSAIGSRTMAGEGLQPARKIAGCHDLRQVGAGLVVVMEALDRRVRDRAARPLDLSVVRENTPRTVF